MEFGPENYRKTRDRRIKAKKLIPLVPIAIIIAIYLLLVASELDSYIGTKYEINGFEQIWPIPSGTYLTSDGILRARFMNLWFADVTILDITLENEESGMCRIYEDEAISYDKGTHPLPTIIPGWGRFNLMAFKCAPGDREIKEGDTFKINVTMSYVIGEVFYVEGVEDIMTRVSMLNIDVHEESGEVKGEYRIVHDVMQ